MASRELVPTVLTLASMVVSLGLLGLALKSLPVGTAYAVWTGIGTVGTAILGIYLLGEPATVLRLGCIGADRRRHHRAQARRVNQRSIAPTGDAPVGRTWCVSACAPCGQRSARRALP